MITSKIAKIILAVVFFIIGYAMLSYAMFLGLQVDTMYGTIGMIVAFLGIAGLMGLYYFLTKKG